MSEDCITFLIIVLIFLAIFVGVEFDHSQLTHVSYPATIIDKWSTESCTPMFDGNANYLGESCGTDFVLALKIADKRVLQNVNSSAFYNQYYAGQSVTYSYDLGRLGFKHNLQILSEPH